MCVIMLVTLLRAWVCGLLIIGAGGLTFFTVNKCFCVIVLIVDDIVPLNEKRKKNNIILYFLNYYNPPNYSSQRKCAVAVKWSLQCLELKSQRGCITFFLHRGFLSVVFMTSSTDRHSAAVYRSGRHSILLNHFITLTKALTEDLISVIAVVIVIISLFSD